MRKLMIGVAAASALAVPVAAQAHGAKHHAHANHSHRHAAKSCTRLHTYPFRVRGRFVSFTPSTAAGAAPTDGALTVLVHRARPASRRYLRSLSKPLHLPANETFTLSGAKVHFRVPGASFATATSNDVVRILGRLRAPARGCAGAYTLTVKHVFVRPARQRHAARRS
jgi:hypothetical protein